jgi:carbon storage regulator CsrA
MLVLSRKQNEEILIGKNVCIKVVGIFGNKVRLGISAPTQVTIRRAELDFFGQTSDCLPAVGPLETVDLSLSTHDDCLVEHL